MEQKNFDFQQQPGKKRTRFDSSDPNDALVSIITPFYNAGRYFEQTFNSVMNQTFPWFEWIIVNDGSPKEEDVALLHRLAATDPRVTVITQENAGPCHARNNAIAHTRTDLIVPLDADDLFDPTYIECLYWSLKYNPDADWSYTNSFGFQELEYIWDYPFSARTMKTYNFLNYTGMIRKKAIADIGGYKDEKQAYHEDWRFWLDMLSMSKKPVRIASHLFWYRRLGTGRLSSVNSNAKLSKRCDEIIKEAARTVDTSVQALEYPVKGTQHAFRKPEFTVWNRRTYRNHDRKRVLWLIPWMMMGGADKFNLDAVAGLKEKGFDSFILATKPSPDEWRQKFEAYTDEIFTLPNFLDPAHYLEFVSYYIQSREIDIIMLTNSYEGYYMIPWIRQHFPDVPIVDYVHMEEWYWRNGGYARTSAMLGAVTEKTYVCNSATRQIMIDHFGRAPETVETVYIGVDEKYFDRSQVNAGTLYQETGISEDRPVVLFICRLHPQKRPFLMLEIAKQVSRQLPSVAFVVVGDGPQEEELRATAQEMGLRNTVFFLGSKEDVRPYYRDARLTLICSLKEGLALTAYESCAMGVPVVSSDVGGQKDLIDDSVGRLIPCAQAESVAFDDRNFDKDEIRTYVGAITEMLSDPLRWEQASKTCRERIIYTFTIEKMADYFANEFTRLIEDTALRAARAGVSQALQLCAPIASELYTMEIQLERAEDILTPGPEKSILRKVKRVLTEDGLGALIRKTLRWIKRKLAR